MESLTFQHGTAPACPCQSPGYFISKLVFPRSISTKRGKGDLDRGGMKWSGVCSICFIGLGTKAYDDLRDSVGQDFGLFLCVMGFYFSGLV